MSDRELKPFREIVPFGEDATERLAMARAVLNCVEASIINPIESFRHSKPGRRPGLSVKTMFLGWILLALDKRQMTLRGLRATFASLPKDDRVELGVETTNGCFVTYNQVQKTWANILDAIAVMNPSAVDPSYEGETFAKWVVDRLIDASLPPTMPRTTSWALDGTVLETWARRTKTNGVSGTKDPGARQGHTAAKNGQRGGTYWGREVHVLTQTRDLDGPPVPLPILRLCVSPPNTQGYATHSLLRRFASEQRSTITQKDNEDD